MTRRSPEASIVMAAFNGARAIANALDSVQRQTFQDWELIVVDDRSSDSSPEIVARRAQADPRIRLLRLSRNTGGPAAPRNAGLAEATGRVLFLIDQDDEWFPQKLERQMAKLASGSFGLVYSDAYVRRSGADDALYSTLWGPMAEGSVAGALLSRCFVPALTAGVPIDVARDIGPFDEELAGVDDWDYWIRIALSGRAVGYVDEPLAVWVDSDTSLSRRRTQQLERALLCLKRHRSDHPEYASFADEHRARLRRELLAVKVGQRRMLSPYRWLRETVPLVRDVADLREVGRALW